MAALVAFATAACAGSLRPGDPGYDFNVSGSYAGRLIVDGQPFEASMRLRTGSGGRVTGTLDVVAPVEISGSAQGRVIDDLLRLTVTYRSGGGCDGRMEGILDVEPGGDVVTGPVTFTDCGEPVGGLLSLRR